MPLRGDREVKDVTVAFLEALREGMRGHRTDWRKHVAPRWQGYRGWPPIPQYLDYRISKVGKGREDSERVVTVDLQLVPSGGYPLRWVTGTLRAWERGAWGVCPTSWTPRG